LKTGAVEVEQYCQGMDEEIVRHTTEALASATIISILRERLQNLERDNEKLKKQVSDLKKKLK
jgi:hypothetical protein